MVRMVQISPSCAFGRIRSLPFVEMGDSDSVREGDRVITCGFPLGPALQPGSPAGSLFHKGIVSGICPHSAVKPRESFLLDMTINRGNSGGPLIDEITGKLVGIVIERVLDPDPIPAGIGVAVPVNLAKSYVATARQLPADLA